ncbi:diphthine--ammonia ligase-like isoform X2 [Gordionus sp. m RMFG-2023]
MYQTVGHEGISYIAKATELPLHIQYIKGKPLHLDIDYEMKVGDEVEDLYSLLKSVKAKENIEGVSCGAIWSEYQKNRLEHVCERLDLEPICYLWGSDQSQLLSEMLGTPDFDIILVKVACIGLNLSDLGQNLKVLEPKLRLNHQKFGINLCGEGGEYETFVTRCKMSNFYKHDIVIVKSRKLSIGINGQANDSSLAPVGYLKMDELKLE